MQHEGGVVVAVAQHVAEGVAPAACVCGGDVFRTVVQNSAKANGYMSASVGLLRFGEYTQGLDQSGARLGNIRRVWFIQASGGSIASERLSCA